MRIDITFRRATPNDFNHVKEISESVWNQDYLITNFFYILENPENNFFVIEQNGKLVGCINARIYNFEDKLGYLEALRVKSDSQNQGIGTCLVSDALKFLSQKEIKIVYYVTGFTNEPSKQVAMKNKFIKVFEWPIGYIKNPLELISENFVVKKSIEPSLTEILDFLKENEYQWVNMIWKFFPLSSSTLVLAKELSNSHFLFSSNKDLLSLVTISPQSEGIRLTGNLMGKPNREALINLLQQINSIYPFRSINECRFIVEEKNLEIYSKIDFMDFQANKALILFQKSLTTGI